MSDKYLTEHCGMLNYLLPEDIVLAYLGFDISAQLACSRLTFIFQHLQRVKLNCLRQKFSILQGTLPIDMVTKRTGEDCPLIDRIVRVCAALCNVCNSVVPFD